MDQNNQRLIITNSIQIAQQRNSPKEPRKERRQLPRLTCQKLDYMDNNNLTIIDTILINVIEKENKRKYTNILSEADRMEGHKTQSYFQPRTETLPQILRHLKTGAI